MDIQNQIETAKILYAKDLVRSIFPEDSWMTKSRDDSQYVMGKSVQRSNVGGKPNVRKNKQALKIEAKRKSLLADTYPINEFATDPEGLVFTEEILSSPEFRSVTLEEHRDSLNEQVGHELKSRWAPSLAEFMVRTSGANKAATGKGATGTRKKVTYSDWLDAYQIYLLSGMMPENALVPAHMYRDLLEIEEFIKFDWVSDRAVPTGKIGRILNMDVWSTPMGVHYDNAATPVVQELVPDDDGSSEGVQFAGGPNSNLGILIWNEKYVTRAKGNAKVFINPDDAESQSTLMSANCIAGGDKYRKDQLGVVSIIESFGS